MDWTYLSDLFVNYQESYVFSPEYDDQTLKDSRSKGTFWRIEKALNFFWTPESYDFTDYVTTMMGTVEDNKGNCGLVFYFPAMTKREEQFIQRDKFKITETYGRPLAIAPFCGADAIPNDGLADYDWSEVGYGRTPLVFHNYFTEDVSDDLYFMLK